MRWIGALLLAAAALLAPPAGARSIAAVFRGVDSAGEPLVAVGYRALR